MPGSEAANPHLHARQGRCRAALSVSMQVGLVLVLTGTRCLIASSLSGTVMDESFISLSEVRVKLLLQSKQAPQRSVFTDKEGVFTFSDLAPGEYTVRVDSQAFISVEIHDIHIDGVEDHHLRRILL